MYILFEPYGDTWKINPLNLFIDTTHLNGVATPNLGSPHTPGQVWHGIIFYGLKANPSQEKEPGV
jgi:hypothetical protein